MTSISLTEAIEYLHSNRVIAVPTDTVYGLAAGLKKELAVKQLFEIKKRSNDKPCIILFSDYSQIASMISFIPPLFKQLAEQFWPGALTIILPVHTHTISSRIRSGLTTTGFRIPNHPILLELLQQFGPLVVSSANLSGFPSAKLAEEVERDFGRDFPILYGDPFVKGLESTIITYQDNGWKILRSGAISSSELQKYINIL